MQILSKLFSSVFSIFLIACTYDPSKLSKGDLPINQDSRKIITIGYFSGEPVWIGNFQRMEVYQINEYYINPSELPQNKVNEIKDKIVLVKGYLEIISGTTFPPKSSRQGRIYEPYKEPDKMLIQSPEFYVFQENEKIVLKISILDYFPNALHSQIEGMPDEWNDGTKVLLSLPDGKKKEITIFHNQPEPKDSLWRKKGQEHQIKIPVRYLYPKKGTTYHIYSVGTELID